MIFRASAQSSQTVGRCPRLMISIRVRCGVRIRVRVLVGVYPMNRESPRGEHLSDECAISVGPFAESVDEGVVISEVKEKNCVVGTKLRTESGPLRLVLSIIVVYREVV